MSGALAAPSTALANWAEVVGGFSTLFATIVASVVVPVAIFEARREKSLASLERLSAAVHSYLDRRAQFYDESLVRNEAVDDEFADVFENFYSVPQIDNMIAMVEFAVDHLYEIERSWVKHHPSILRLIDRDTKYLDGQITVEAVSTYVADNACAVALEEDDLIAVDAYKVYVWDDVTSFNRDESFPTRSYSEPSVSEADWEKYSFSEEYRVRMKRRLLNAVHYRKNRRHDLREAMEIIDSVREKLKLSPLFRHPDDMVESVTCQ